MKKSLEDFAMKDAKQRKSQCRQCVAEWRKGWRVRHPRVKEKRRIAAVLEAVASFKEANPCMDCGLCYPYFVMDFDHLGEKLKNISKMASQGYSLVKVMEEIKKCDLVCANCHRFRTHARR